MPRQVCELLSFLKKCRKKFLQCDRQKAFVKCIENLHLSEKFIGDNLSITDIALRIRGLTIISGDFSNYRLSLPL